MSVVIEQVRSVDRLHVDSTLHAAARTIAVPRVSTTAAVSTATLVSLAPSLLPRTAPMQAIVTGVLVAFGLGIAGAARRLTSRTASGRVSDSVRLGIALAGLGVIAWAISAAAHWQNALRSAMRVPSIGPGYWLVVFALSAAIVTALYGISAVAAWALHRVGRLRGLSAAVVAALALGFLGVPAVVDWRLSSYSNSNDFLDAAVRQPMSAVRSGSPDSAVTWQSLGAEGRKFVASRPDTASVRVYAGINSAPDLTSRAALAVADLERAGGLRRSNIVVAIPTGSGWIDGNAVRGFERRFNDDVAIAGVQYSYAPSWATFIFGRKAAEDSARALYTAVAERLSQIPATQRAKLYIYGQSLGSIGGSSALSTLTDRTCGALWAGPPAGAVAHHDATVLANSSDPVVRWSPDLLFRAPDLRTTRVDAPMPQWLPVVSFVQTTVDLLGALDAPAGHGHRYGTDQGTAMPGC